MGKRHQALDASAQAIHTLAEQNRLLRSDNTALIGMLKRLRDELDELRELRKLTPVKATNATETHMPKRAKIHR